MHTPVEINPQELGRDLIELCKTPGPTQACVKVSEDDIRINGEFPMERVVKDLVGRINEDLKKEGKKGLLIIRHMGNLVIVGGLNRSSDTQDREEIRIIDDGSQLEEVKNKIKKIPIVFGAHLDEITYIVTNKRSDLLDGNDVYKIMPICNPPKLTKYDMLEDKKGKYIKGKLKKDEEKALFVDELLNEDCKILGFRRGEDGKIEFRENIGSGKICKVQKIVLSFKPKISKEIVPKLERKDESYLLLKVESKEMDIKGGDIVIQDHGDWKKKTNFGNNKDAVIKSKALDDRVGCIAAIYAIKELARREIPSKAILTSSEEGVPEDVSWGRLVRGAYKEFCMDETITIICDGIDGKNLKEFGDRSKCLSEAIVVPYTSNGKGGGDAGIFSLFREWVIPELDDVYDEKVAVTSTDYCSRSYESKIMDRWTQIGFVQWSCGSPLDPKAICHNEETVCMSQVINIVRTLVCLAELLHSKS